MSAAAAATPPRADAEDELMPPHLFII